MWRKGGSSVLFITNELNEPAWVGEEWGAVVEDCAGAVEEGCYRRQVHDPSGLISSC